MTSAEKYAAREPPPESDSSTSASFCFFGSATGLSMQVLASRSLRSTKLAWPVGGGSAGSAFD